MNNSQEQKSPQTIVVVTVKPTSITITTTRSSTNTKFSTKTLLQQLHMLRIIAKHAKRRD